MNNVIAEHLGMEIEKEIEGIGTEIVTIDPESGEILESDDSEFIDPSVPMDQAQTFEFVEKSIRGMMQDSTKAVKELASLANQSDSPRAYEVLANMIKTTVDAGKSLIDINSRKVIPGKDNGTGIHTGDVVNNNLILAGSDDVDDIVERLAKAIKK